MFEHDRSAARGEMAARKLVAFEHSNALGTAHAHDLFERVRIERVNGAYAYPIGDKQLDDLPPARRFSDYRVTIERKGLPKGVTIRELL
jgi:CRISPR-associated protein Csd2